MSKSANSLITEAYGLKYYQELPASGLEWEYSFSSEELRKMLRAVIRETYDFDIDNDMFKRTRSETLAGLYEHFKVS